MRGKGIDWGVFSERGEITVKGKRALYCKGGGNESGGRRHIMEKKG